MYKLVICIPTYNRAEMVEEMLLRCASLYHQRGVDIYFFDSGEDNKTQTIVDDYRARFKNIFYRRIPSEVHSNIKVLNIYQEFSNLQKYDYLWLCQDHIQLTEEGIQLISNKCSEGFDICVLNYRDVDKLGERIYTNANELFYDCAWHMTSYMATVVHLPFLRNVDWKYIFKRYTIPQRVNHSHVALIFEQLSRKSEIKAIHTPISPKHIRVSAYRKDAYWRDAIFSVWCEYWMNMIRALPDCYQDKNKVIRKHGVNSGIFSWKKFIEYRENGLYNIGIYRKYYEEWTNLTNIPKVFLWFLAYLPSSWVKLLSSNTRLREKLKRRISRFCISQQKVYVYGCGFMAQKISDLLDGLCISYQGYIVSDLSNEKKSFNGKEVVSFDNYMQKDLKAGIIIAMKRENAEQVIKDHPELKLHQLFFMYRYQHLWD